MSPYGSSGRKTKKEFGESREVGFGNHPYNIHIFELREMLQRTPLLARAIWCAFECPRLTHLIL